MKVEIKNECPCPAKKEYPYLGKSQHNGAIVLFIKSNTGTCVTKTTFEEIGKYHEYWNESIFEKFTGEVVLSN